MVYMTKSQYDSKLAKLKARNETIEYKRKLRKERWKYLPKFVLPSTSKIVGSVKSYAQNKIGLQ